MLPLPQPPFPSLGTAGLSSVSVSLFLFRGHIFFFFKLFICFGCVGSCCHARTLPRCAEQGCFLVVRSVGSRARASVVVVHRLSCPMAAGSFSDQGSRPLCWPAGLPATGPPGKKALEDILNSPINQYLALSKSGTEDAIIIRFFSVSLWVLPGADQGTRV